jgi:hypothetical protein
MKRFLFAAVATCVCAGLLQSAEAGNRGGNGGGNRGGNFGGNFVQKQNFQPKFVQNHNFQQNHNFNKQVFNKPVFNQNHNFQKKIVIAAPHFHQSQIKFQNYHLTYGRKFSGGYCYVGNTHQHWVSTIWAPDCGCYTYYCPYTSVWYYWCQPDGCFYPVSYCPYGTYVF